jgi:Streptomycin adenylyltransferase
MSASRYISPLTESLAKIPECQGIYLSGSHARGTDDAFSDLDLVLVADHADQSPLRDQARTALTRISPLVMFRAHTASANTLINVVTADWDRIDLLLQPQDRFLTRAANTVRPLHDPNGLFQKLLPGADDIDQVVGKIAWTTEEFIRILGLVSVGLGRQEHLLCAIGAGLLRDHLITLMKAEAGTLAEGALHLSRSVSARDMSILLALPVVLTDRDWAVAAHLALARAFLPRARAFLSKHGEPWPEAFEAATRAHLALAFDMQEEELW